MANPERMRQLVGRIGSDPTLIDELVSKKDKNERRASLVSRGIFGTGEAGPGKEEMAAEIRKLLTPSPAQPAPPASGERVVEWVGAIATAAAGAAAAP